MPPASITVSLNAPIATLDPRLHGHFIEHLGQCVNGGIWVGTDSPLPNLGGLRADVVEALAELAPPVVRWPGGCFADDYHWEDGVGQRKDRPRRVNLWWGQDIEDNHFGTHEFIDLCRYLRAEPYLAGNVGSGAVREMREWHEYCNFTGDSTLARRRAANGSPLPFGVRLWGVGNENWGCGGNFCPEDYAAQYKRFATYLRPISGITPQLIACGPDGNNLDWTRRFFAKLGDFPQIWGYAAHYYCGTAGESATSFNLDQWYELLHKAARVEQLICDQRRLMNDFPAGRRAALVLDEWGTWHLPTPGRNPAHLWQQNTLRDALAAAITLDTLHRHADKVAMANIAQAVNVLQAMVLTEGEQLILTPTYHVFSMYRAHRQGQSLPIQITSPDVQFAIGADRAQMPALSGSASRRGEQLTISIVNVQAGAPITAELCFDDATEIQAGSARCMTADDLAAHNTSADPHAVAPRATNLVLNRPMRHTFPPASVTLFQFSVSR